MADPARSQFLGLTGMARGCFVCTCCRAHCRMIQLAASCWRGKLGDGRLGSLSDLSEPGTAAHSVCSIQRGGLVFCCDRRKSRSHRRVVRLRSYCRPHYPGPCCVREVSCGHHLFFVCALCHGGWTLLSRAFQSCRRGRTVFQLFHRRAPAVSVVKRYSS